MCETDNVLFVPPVVVRGASRKCLSGRMQVLLRVGVASHHDSMVAGIT